MSLADNTWAFAQVLEDVVARGLQKKAVVLYPRLQSRRTSAQSLGPGWQAIKVIMNELFAAGVPIVNCAGDDAPGKGFDAPNKFPVS